MVVDAGGRLWIIWKDAIYEWNSTLSVTSVSGHLMEDCFGPDMKNWATVPIRSLFDAPVYRYVPEGMKNIAKTLVLNSTLSVTSVSGHLMEDCFGPDMKNWATVPIRSLFDAPVYRYVPEGMKNIAKTLVLVKFAVIEESAKCDVLVIWTDCDREGEGIGAEIAKVCSESNPRIDVYRARFSEITPRAINYASQHLTRLDQRIVDAVQCRSELDLRIGMIGSW
ncbi:toprim domain protein [Oesophagostomum dentatum]|uniref:DNA topoisomerase n=1 Tax=Oesophagostomum dentatum TaxID=61180 RepID=A0A0B1SSY4_OESDE|nr:toprim domain protein [Oesophagostomum dentatum]